MIIVECDDPECGNAFEAGKNGGAWQASPDTVKSFVLDDTDWGDFVYVYLPDGWRVERIRRHAVIHCPGHTAL